MKTLVFRIGAALLFGIILTACIITSLDNNGGSYSDISEQLQGEPVIKTGKIYYNKLTRMQQYIYDSIAKAADTLEYTTEKMPLVAEMTDVSLSLNALMADHPEYFYIDAESFSLEDYSYTVENSDGETREVTGSSLIDEKYTCLRMYYTEAADELKLKKNRLSAAVSKAESLISGLEDELDIQTALHDYIISICERSQDGGVYDSNAYGALVEGKADPEGYHKAFKLLLSRAGIISHLTYGEVRGTRSVWCTVLINDKYYNTDVYEDDLDYTVDGEILRGAVTHAYMNVSDDAIASTHKGKPSDIPKCTDTQTYYTSKGLVCSNENMTENLISRELETFVKYKKQCIEIYCEYDVSAEDVETYVFRQFELLYPEYTCTCKVVRPKQEFDAYSVCVEYLLKTE